MRTQRHEFADWYANMAVEHNLDREIGSDVDDDGGSGTLG